MTPRHPIPGSSGQRKPLGATPCVRLGPLVGIPAVLHSLGCEPRPLIEKAGFTLAQFADPDLRIPFVQGSRLLAQCAAATGCEHFGLLLGERSAPSHLGIAGYLLQSAPDVRTALRGLLEFLELHDEGGVATLVTDPEVTLLGYAIHLPGVEAQEQIYDLSAAMIYKIMRGLCGDDWRPGGVLIMRRPPEAPARYQQFFDAPVRFGSDQTALAFATHWLDHCLPTSDPLLHNHLEQEAVALRAAQDQALAGRLRRLLHQCLVSGGCSASRLAQLLGVHERTLNRQLEAEGTSFRRELDRVRFTAARQLLTATDASLLEIAVALGYADGSSFSHAFKRWSGATPARWRKAVTEADTASAD
jgi:AraC-like DNA-binding protein